MPITTLQAGKQRSRAFKILSKNYCLSSILYPIKLSVKCTVRIFSDIHSLKIMYFLHTFLQEVTGESVPPKQKSARREIRHRIQEGEAKGIPRRGEQLVQNGAEG